MLVRYFLIESSSKLLATRTGIKTRSSSILNRIRPLILELLALEWRKFHTFVELEYLWSQLANLVQILCVASFWCGKGCIRFWGRLDQDWFPWQQKAPIDLQWRKRRLHLFSVVSSLEPGARKVSLWYTDGPSVVVHIFKLEYVWSQLANLHQILWVASLGWGKCSIRF